MRYTRLRPTVSARYDSGVVTLLGSVGAAPSGHGAKSYIITFLYYKLYDSAEPRMCPWTLSLSRGLANCCVRVSSSESVGPSSDSVGPSSGGVGPSSESVGPSSDNVGRRDAKSEFCSGQYAPLFVPQRLVQKKKGQHRNVSFSISCPCRSLFVGASVFLSKSFRLFVEFPFCLRLLIEFFLSC